MNNILADLRNKQKLTQVELANILNTNQKNVSAWERGERTPKPAMMQKIQDYFEVPKEQIFFGAFSYSK